MESVVERIRARNGAFNAIVYDDTEEALAEARRAGRQHKTPIIEEQDQIAGLVVLPHGRPAPM
jgi:hypothetical protein